MRFNYKEYKTPRIMRPIGYRDFWMAPISYGTAWNYARKLGYYRPSNNNGAASPIHKEGM